MMIKEKRDAREVPDPEVRVTAQRPRCCQASGLTLSGWPS
jgi:hypothetical protein